VQLLCTKTSSFSITQHQAPSPVWVNFTGLFIHRHYLANNFGRWGAKSIWVLEFKSRSIVRKRGKFGSEPILNIHTHFPPLSPQSFLLVLLQLSRQKKKVFLGRKNIWEARLPLPPYPPQRYCYEFIQHMTLVLLQNYCTEMK